MNAPSTPPSRPSEGPRHGPLNSGAQCQKLVQELLAMRDALMRLSLSLRDLQFETDQQSRQQAQTETQALLRAMQQPTRCKHPDQS
jgi:hypothetical protein